MYFKDGGFIFKKIRSIAIIIKVSHFSFSLV